MLFALVNEPKVVVMERRDIDLACLTHEGVAFLP